MPGGSFASEPHGSSSGLWKRADVPLKSTPVRVAPAKLAPSRLAPPRSAPVRLALTRLASARLAPPRLTPTNRASFSLARLRLVFANREPVRLAPPKFDFGHLGPDHAAWQRAYAMPWRSWIGSFRMFDLVRDMEKP